MKSPLIATILLVLAAPAFASPQMTATPAQWKDIHRLYEVFGQCPGDPQGDLELKKACNLSTKLQEKLEKQGFCFYKRLIVGKLAWHGPEEDRAKLWPEGEKQCYTLHDPAH
jgi:hypothetical protein